VTGGEVSPAVPLSRSREWPGEALWEALVRPGAKLKPGRRIEIGPDLAVQIVASRDDGTRVVRLDTPLPIDVALERYGRVPLPPYIDREPEADDTERYQTVYARERGSVAAPTAGLHFTPAVLERLQSGGAGLVRLVLHVGVGTFRPVEVEDPARHRMHAEWYRVPGDAAASLNRTRQAGGRIWCVGTTVARTLETVTDPAGVVHAGAGWTDIFIRPPHTFRAMDRLVTNFHLPRSTLLMLVAAFAGLELVLEAYAEAVRRGYRFYSYGDAMLIL
jgi:S-adenosylmethionine:tRNA ribosyltransferase-isomerase